MGRSGDDYFPSLWTLLAAAVAVIGLLAWGVTLHPGIWGGREFEGMAQTLILGLFAQVCGVVVLICSMIGMIRRDFLAVVVLAATAGLAALLFMLRDTSYDA